MRQGIGEDEGVARVVRVTGVLLAVPVFRRFGAVGIEVIRCSRRIGPVGRRMGLGAMRVDARHERYRFRDDRSGLSHATAP